ncbi:hypothetical protein [Gordonia sputi]
MATPPGTAKYEGQREQRAVDVCLHDVLQQVHTLAPGTGQWLTLGNELRARADWSSVAGRVDAAMSAAGTSTSKRTRGYFWSSMLACTAALLDAGTTNPTAPAIASIAMCQPRVAAGMIDPLPASIPWAARVAYPRKRFASIIREATVPAAVDVAAHVIADALRRSALPPHQQLVIIGTVGITICPDLWQSPAAVHYLLVPTLRTLRQHFGSTFSLDNHPTSGALAEDTVYDVLGAKWEAWRGRGGLW